MIVLSVIIIWLGRKRGMLYWNWLAGYLCFAWVELLAWVTLHNPPVAILLDIFGIIYIATFFLWPYLATDDEKQRMQHQAQAYIDDEKKSSEQYYENLKDWLV